jgi:PAS domain S-box-containing protein
MTNADDSGAASPNTALGRTPARRTEELRPLADAGLDDEAVWALLDAAPDGIVVVDESGQILFVSRRTEELFGRDRAELLGRSVDDLLPDRYRQAHRAHRTRYRAEPRTRSMGTGVTLFGRRNDGSEFPVEISLSPLPTSSGLRIVAAVRDVTDRVEAEASERQVRRSLDATRDAVLIIDTETLRFTYANEGAVAQVGYTRDELLGMTPLHILPDMSDAQLRDLMAPLVDSGESSIRFTTTHRHRNGEDIPVEVLMQAIPGDDGTPHSYVEVVRDIRERVETEERLRQAEQHFRVVADRERIARDLHDTVIQKIFAAGMTIQGVWARTADPEQAERLSQVIDDLDDTIREIRSVIFSLQSQSRDVSSLRADVLRVVDDGAAALGFQPTVRFLGPVDATTASVGVELLPALREALSNVARHAEATTVDIVLDCSDNVVLTVTDNGLGLTEPQRTGHGLPNLADRAARLGGSCQVMNQPSGGTLVQWSVPNV